MRCKNCDYPLWTLKTRSCPECGRAFAPSDYDFVPNTVRFCCPHCEQAYYGTDASGHLFPRQFECVSCKTFVRMDDMVLRPAEGVAESQTRANANPWLNRREHGRTRALFSTIGMAMVSPARLMQVTPVDGGHGAAWGLAAIVQFLITIVTFLPLALLMGGMGAVAGGGTRGVAVMLGSIAVWVGFAFITTMLSIVIWGVVTHLILRLTGGALHGIGRTYDALCYSSAANVLTAVPCFGAYFGWIWWVVSAVLMVKEAQQVSGGRASLAVLTAPILSILTCAGAYFGFLAWAISMGGAGGPGGWTNLNVNSAMEQREAQVVATALVDYATRNANTGPPHAAQLLVSDNLNAWDFVTSNAATAMPDVPIDDTNLQSLAVARKPAVIKAANAAAAALPPNVVAHRLGNFVFTCHGVDFTSGAPLWIVILSHDPDVAANQPQSTYYAGLVDGTIVQFTAAELPTILAAQNTLRAGQNLPPIPDPTTVTHTNPATAP